MAPEVTGVVPSSHCFLSGSLKICFNWFCLAIMKWPCPSMGLLLSVGADCVLGLYFGLWRYPLIVSCCVSPVSTWTDMYTYIIPEDCGEF